MIYSWSVSAWGQTGSCSWLCVFRVTEPDGTRRLSSGKQGLGLRSVGNIRWRILKGGVAAFFVVWPFGRISTFGNCQALTDVAIETLPVSTSQCLHDLQWGHAPVAVVLVFISGARGVWIFINGLLHIWILVRWVKVRPPPVHLKDLQDLQQGLLWPTLVMMKCSVLKVCSRVVGHTCLMSVNTTTNSFEVHGVVGSRTHNLVHQSASWLFNITVQSFFSLNVTANKFSEVHCCIRWLLLCSHFHLFDAEEQKCRAEKQMMNLRSPQRCFHSAAASPGHPSNLCRNKLLLHISPSSDWLPRSPCLHPLFPFHPKAPWFVPTLPLPPLVSSTSLGRSTPPFLRPSLPLPPPTLSAAGWKTQSFIHLFPPPFLCSLFILVNITLPVGTLRGS